MRACSVADLIGRIPDGADGLRGRLIHDLESVRLPVKFLILDPARESFEDSVPMPAAYLFTSALHLIALSDEVLDGPDLTIIAHELGHARLFEEGYPLCTVATGLAGEEARYYSYLACVLPTALQDPIINARLAREGYPVEGSYVRMLAPEKYGDSRSANEAFRVLYALSVHAHLQVFEGNSVLQGYWDACVGSDAGMAEIVTGILPPAPSGMTPDMMRDSIARFCDRYDRNRRLRPVFLPFFV